MDFQIEHGSLAKAIKMSGESRALSAWLKTTGCAGRQLELKAQAPAAADAEQWVLASVEGGVSLYARKMDADLLEGSRLQWESAFGGGRWALDSPKAKAACGCGMSIDFGEFEAKLALLQPAATQQAAKAAPKF